MSAVPAEYARYFRADDIAPLECLDAFYTRQVFTPHFHEEYVVNALTLGAQSYRYRQFARRRRRRAADHPGEVHRRIGRCRRSAIAVSTVGDADPRRQPAGRASVEPFFRQTVITMSIWRGGWRCCSRCWRSATTGYAPSALYAVFADVLAAHGRA
jgi:hypothetical protein